MGGCVLSGGRGGGREATDLTANPPPTTTSEFKKIGKKVGSEFSSRSKVSLAFHPKSEPKIEFDDVGVGVGDHPSKVAECLTG